MQTNFASFDGCKVSAAVRAFAALSVALVGTSAFAGTLDRVKESGHLKLGFISDARPFTHRTEAGNVQGYSAELCQQIADRVKSQLNLPQLSVDWIPVTPANHIADLKDGKIDILCTPTVETAAKRQDVAYSKPVFPGGVRAVVRRDTAKALREALGDNPPPTARTVWRGSPVAKVLDKANFAVAKGSTTERWLTERIHTLKVGGKALPVADYRSGIQALLDRKADVFFGDRAVVLGVMDNDEAGSNLIILDRWFTHEPAALALARNDDDFRLLVDRTLSDTYTAAGFPDQFSKWNGTMDDNTKRFFDWVSFSP